MQGYPAVYNVMMLGLVYETTTLPLPGQAVDIAFSRPTQYIASATLLSSTLIMSWVPTGPTDELNQLKAGFALRHTQGTPCGTMT